MKKKKKRGEGDLDAALVVVLVRVEAAQHIGLVRRVRLAEARYVGLRGLAPAGRTAASTCVAEVRPTHHLCAAHRIEVKEDFRWGEVRWSQEARLIHFC